MLILTAAQRYPQTCIWPFRQSFSSLGDATR